jgi:hypothetical protein
MPSYEIRGSSTGSRKKSEKSQFGNNSRTRSPHVEGRCVKLVVIVAELAVRICETKFDLWQHRVGKIVKNILDVVL